jgi:hypothetical protein
MLCVRKQVAFSVQYAAHKLYLNVSCFVHWIPWWWCKINFPPNNHIIITCFYIISLKSGLFLQIMVFVSGTELEGHSFESRCCQWNFLLTSFRLHYGPGVDSASNRNEYQEYFLGGTGGQCIGLTALPPSCADCLEIWEPEPLGTLRGFQACNGIACTTITQTLTIWEQNGENNDHTVCWCNWYPSQAAGTHWLLECVQVLSITQLLSYI